MSAIKAGILYLVPTPLGDTACDLVLPLPVLQQVASLDYLIAENAKSARAFLKGVHAITPLRLPLQEIEIAKLDVSTKADQLLALLEPLLRSPKQAPLRWPIPAPCWWHWPTNSASQSVRSLARRRSCWH
jgi:16S rRNA C1402 (ribose-2'-O) methylase RsmI